MFPCATISVGEGGQRCKRHRMGTVTKISPAGFVEVDGEVHEVQPAIWEKSGTMYSASTKTLKHERHRRRVHPVPACDYVWAVTIHKSQGQDYDRATWTWDPALSSGPGPYVVLATADLRTELEGLYPPSRPLRPVLISAWTPDVQR
jgi:hypothetical protein